jgi:putative N6-adenine-specific DNA methylase
MPTSSTPDAPRPRAGRGGAPRLHCFAVTAPGLEPLAAAELRALVAPRAGGAPAPEPGGVAFDASLEELYAANLWLRTVSRVTVRLAEFTAVSFRDLERFARRVPWETVTSRDRPLRLRVTCRKSRLYHSDAVAERVADAVAHRVGGDGAFDPAGADDVPDGEGSDDAGDGAQLLVVRFLHDRCTISADSSGALLHRRGYRQAVGKAPLRETLAAGLLLAAGYDGTGPLVDPLCGSGTIPIEAALIARRLAPGRQRAFAFEHWPGFDPGVWDALRDEADGRARPQAAHPILASDRDAGAVRAAVANAERAGVAGDVAVSHHPLSAAPVPDGGGPGWLVTNPPYGKRVGDSDALRDLWARLGQFARVRCPGWQVAVFAPEAALGRQLELPLRPALRTANGGLPIDVLAGTVPARPVRGGPDAGPAAAAEPAAAPAAPSRPSDAPA